MAVLKGERLLGAFGERGGMIAVATAINPDPDAAAAKLIQLAKYLENTVPPMRAAKAIAKADMAEHFKKDTAPSGDQWVELDPEYLTKKSKMKGLRTHPDDILTLTRKMEKAATSEAAWTLTPNGELFFNTHVLPDFWPVHQFGSKDQGNVGRAAFHRGIETSDKTREGRRDPATGKVVGRHDSLDIGRGQATPARPFIGLSKEAIAKIAGVFDLWFDEGVDIAISKVGTVQERLAGKFGRKLFP